MLKGEKRRRDDDASFFGSHCFNAQRGLIDRLRTVGLDKYVELPQIAVMGDTSSGKSSVLSAISGIQFPSNNELTTRCPTQLALNHSATFSGTIRLVRYNRIEDEKQDFTILKRPEDIEHEIARLTLKLKDEGQHISDDMISIEVYGPSYPDLTLLDLPGLVRTVADGEDRSIIPRVRALVERHLKQERKIILAVVPANVDIHNTEILQAAEEADPEGQRTISIITKPDLVDPGAEKSVIDLLYNRKKELKLGYHAVKCRGQKDLNDGVSIAEGIELERQFFELTEAWKDVDHEKWGIGRLTEKLVLQLEHLIGKTLNTVISEIDKHLHSTKVELLQLGESMDSRSDRRAFYCRYVDGVCQLMKGATEGSYNDFFFAVNNEDGLDNRARALLRKEDDKFSKTISKTRAPESVSKKEKVVAGDYVEVNIGGKWLIRKVVTSGGLIVANAMGVKISVQILNEERDAVSTQAIENWRPLEFVDLTTLKRQIADNRGDEIAVFPSYDLFCGLVGHYVRAWEAPTVELLAQYERVLKEVFNRALDHAMSSKYERIKTRSAAIVYKVMEVAKKATGEVLGDTLEAERRPYTLNSNLYETLMKLRTEPLMKALEQLCTSNGRLIHIDAALAVMKNFGVGNASNEDREALEMQNAIKAYLEIAKTRFIDNVPRLLEQHFVKTLVRQVKTELDVIQDDLLESLLQEAPVVVRRRADLKNKLRSLEESKEAIQNL